MDIVVEPESCDPWTRHVLSPGMTCCVLHETSADNQQRNSDAGAPAMDELLSALVRRDQIPGRVWVVHVSGPADEVAAVVREAGHRSRAPRTTRPAGGADTAHATFVLDPGDCDAADLIGVHGGDRVIALLGVRSDRAAFVAASLEDGRDVEAVAAVDVLITRQPRSGRTTVARREPMALPRSVEAAAPAPTRGALVTAPVLRRLPRPRLVRDIGLRLSALQPRRAATRLVALPWIVGAGAAVVALAVVAVVALTMSHRPSVPHAAAVSAPVAPVLVDGAAAARALEGPVVGGVAVAAPVPPGRVGAATAYDPARGRVVLFGGRGAAGALLGDTWTFDGSAWAESPARRPPPARTGAAAAWDQAIGAVLLYGGTGPTGAQLNDTWAWNGSTWTTLAPAGAHSPDGVPVGISFDTAHHELVLVTAGAADPSRPGAALAEAWAWSGQAWTRLSAASPPLLTGSATVTYDSALAATMLIDVHSSSVWLFDGTAWTAGPSTGLALSPAAATRAAWEPASSVVVLLQDGESGAGSSATWTFDGTVWRYDATSAAPEQVGALTTDPATKGVIAFAGTTGGADLGTLSRWMDGVWGPAA